MKFFLALLSLTLAVTSGAQNMHRIGVGSGELIPSAFNKVNSNFVATPQVAVWDFRSWTNGGTPGLPFTNAQGRVLNLQWSDTSGSNISRVVDGYLTFDTRTVSNLSVYPNTAPDFPVNFATLQYMATNVNAAGTVGPQPVFLIQTNSFGALGSAPTLGNGVHAGIDGNNITFQLINSGIGAQLGSIPIRNNSLAGDGLIRTVTLYFDQPGGRIIAQGDNIDGVLTNEVLKSVLATGTNRSYVACQIYALGTTNLFRTMHFRKFAVGNAAAGALAHLENSGGNYAKRNEANTFFEDQIIDANLTTTGAVMAAGGAGAHIVADRTSYPGNLNARTAMLRDSAGGWIWALYDFNVPSHIFGVQSAGGIPRVVPHVTNGVALGTALLPWHSLHTSTITNTGGGVFIGGQVIGNSNDMLRVTGTNGVNGLRVAANGDVFPLANNVNSLGNSGSKFNSIYGENVTAANTASAAIVNANSRVAVGNSWFLSGTGTPEGAVTAAVGCFYLRTDGGASTTFYVKESGTGNTGWTAK